MSFFYILSKIPETDDLINFVCMYIWALTLFIIYNRIRKFNQLALEQLNALSEFLILYGNRKSEMPSERKW